MIRWLARTLAATGALAALAAPPAALAALAAPALAAQARLPRQEALVGTGTITFTWQGDPALGCAAAGLCGVQGALILDAQGQADLASIGTGVFLNLDGNGTVTTARAITDQGGALGECVDSPQGPGADTLTLAHGAHGRLVAEVGPPLSSGRCAGPVAQDLDHVPVPVTEHGGRHPSFDLRTTRTFVAGPFAGTLVSTVVLRPELSSGAGAAISSGTGPVPPSQGFGGRPFVEHVSLRYRLTALPSAFNLTFAGEGGPFCAVLDSCAATGTVTLSPATGSASTLTLTGSRQVSHRPTTRQVLADVRDGRLALVGQARTALLSSETFASPGAVQCQDSVRAPGVVAISGSSPGRPTRVRLAGPSADVVRTRCPGPSQADVFGADYTFALATGSIAPSGLLARHSELTVTRPGSYSGLGYVGSRTGAIQFMLSLESVRVGVRAR